RRSVKLDNLKTRILCIGNVQEGKGTIYLVRALPHLLSKGLDISVNLVGSIDKSYQALLVNELTRQGTVERVNFLGYESDPERLKRQYQEAEVFVLPTLGEGFPRVLYEAMMSGLPVVASSIGSILDNVRGTDAVTLVPPRNPVAIADAIFELIRNDALRKDRIEAGYRFAARKFTCSPAEQFIGLIQKYEYDCNGAERR
ncbi:MAG: glycosyltransferase family 4 protein, partial [Desulforhabdus sp.]|nr:glycosyltransferase family 4 protein [Desulforhabdus sp.]